MPLTSRVAWRFQNSVECTPGQLKIDCAGCLPYNQTSQWIQNKQLVYLHNSLSCKTMLLFAKMNAKSEEHGRLSRNSCTEQVGYIFNLVGMHCHSFHTDAKKTSTWTQDTRSKIRDGLEIHPCEAWRISQVWYSAHLLPLWKYMPRGGAYWNSKQSL